MKELEYKLIHGRSTTKRGRADCILKPTIPTTLAIAEIEPIGYNGSWIDFMHYNHKKAMAAIMANRGLSETD